MPYLQEKSMMKIVSAYFRTIHIKQLTPKDNICSQNLIIYNPCKIQHFQYITKARLKETSQS